MNLEVLVLVLREDLLHFLSSVRLFTPVMCCLAGGKLRFCRTVVLEDGALAPGRLCSTLVRLRLQKEEQVYFYNIS